jgi:hypothetical protein
MSVKKRLAIDNESAHHISVGLMYLDFGSFSMVYILVLKYST